MELQDHLYEEYDEFLMPKNFLQSKIVKMVSKIEIPSDSCHNAPFTQNEYHINSSVYSIRSFNTNRHYSISLLGNVLLFNTQGFAKLYNDSSYQLCLMDIHPSDLLIACSSGKGAFRIYSSKTLSYFLDSHYHKRPLTALRFAPFSKKILSTSLDGALIVTDLVQNQKSFQFTKDCLTTVTISPSESCVAASNNSGSIFFFDDRDECQISEIKTNQEWINNIVFHQDCVRFASNSSKDSVKIYDIRNPSEHINSISAQGSNTRYIGFINEHLLKVDKKGILYMYELDKFECLSKKKISEYDISSCDYNNFENSLQFVQNSSIVSSHIISKNVGL